MELLIRTEIASDFPAVKFIHDLAFGGNYESILVEKLRIGPDFVPELSLVAESNGRILGHILFYPVHINDGHVLHTSLALGPLSVHPAYQKKGIGGALITEGLKRAGAKSYRSVMVMGHTDYYAKFGFRKASLFGIRSGFSAPEDTYLAIELIEGSLKNIKGLAEYPAQFLSAGITQSALALFKK